MRNIYNLEGRSKAIVILKCLAALLITISHLDVIFPNGFKWMATGGALGDSLFFFCSGFTLFLGRDGGFANWYKRRISRIYPAVFIWGVIATVFYAQDWLVTDVLAAKGLWFLSCIMIYYIIIYAIYHLLKKHLNIIFIIAFIIAFAAGYLIIDTSHVTMYGSSKYIRVFYFIFMLLGTITAININKIVGWGAQIFTNLCLEIVSIIRYINGSLLRFPVFMQDKCNRMSGTSPLTYPSSISSLVSIPTMQH